MATTPTYPTLGPEEVQYYEAGKRRLRQNYLLGKSRNSFERSLTSREGSRNLQDLTRQFGLMREQIPGQYAGRGLLNSGIYENALRRYGTERTRTLGRARQDQSTELGRYDLANRQLRDVYQSAILDLQEQRAARRRAVAAALQAIR